MVQTIVFDLGGVLIDWNPKYLYQKIFTDPKEMDYFLTEVCHQDWNAQQDAGRSLEEATRERIEKFPHYENEIRAFYQRWEEMLGGEISDSVKILDRLREEDLKLFALTNWSDETFPMAQERYSFLAWFEGIVVSGREKVKKPDMKIFQIMIERFNLEPETTIFIDDSVPNIRAAESLGFKSIHFKEPAQCRQEISTLLGGF